MQNDFYPLTPPGAPAQTSNEPVTWSSRRWAGMIAAAFLTQIALIHSLEKPLEIIPSNPQFGSHIYLATDPLSQQQLAEIHDLRDPTLFALPHPEGFSGGAWLTFDPPEYPLTDWDEPRRWLRLDPSGLGTSFKQFVSSETPPTPQIARRPLERLTGLEVYVPTKTLEQHSELKIEGSLAERKLNTVANLPSWPHTEILSDTVVQLLVDEQGDTISVTPIAESGLPQADQYALTFARSAHFDRLPPGTPHALTWGRLVFHWQTTTTNNLLQAGSPPQK